MRVRSLCLRDGMSNLLRLKDYRRLHFCEYQSCRGPAGLRFATVGNRSRVLEDEERPDAELEDEDDLEDIDEDESEELPPQDDEEDEGALEELLAHRPSARRTNGDSDEDGEDILSFIPEPDLPNVDPPPAKLRPVKAQEFVCSKCRLVKKRSQLADRKRMLCRDCV